MTGEIESDAGESIKSALSYLVEESYRINDIEKAVVLRGAYDYLEAMDTAQSLHAGNTIEKTKIDKILNGLNPSEMQHLISLLEPAKHK